MPTMIKKYLKDKQGNYLAPFTTADMVEHADGETTEVKLQTLENQVGDTVLTTTAQNVTDAINELNTEIVGAKTDVTPTTYNSLGERLDAMDVKIAAASGGQAPDVTKAYVDQQDDDIKATIGTLGDLATDEQTSIVLSINELHDEAITCEDYNGTTTTVADLSTRVTDLEVDNASIVQELEDSHTDSNGVVHGTIGQRLDSIEDSYLPLTGGTLTGTLIIDKNNSADNGSNLILTATPQNDAIIAFTNNNNIPQGWLGFSGSTFKVETLNTRISQGFLGLESNNNAFEIDFFLNGTTNRNERCGSIRIEGIADPAQAAELRGTLHLRFADEIVTHSTNIIPNTDGSGHIGIPQNKYARAFFGDYVSSFSFNLQNAGFSSTNLTHTKITAYGDGVINIKNSTDNNDSGGISFGDGGNYISRTTGGILEYRSARHAFYADNGMYVCNTANNADFTIIPNTDKTSFTTTGNVFNFNGVINAQDAQIRTSGWGKDFIMSTGTDHCYIHNTFANTYLTFRDNGYLQYSGHFAPGSDNTCNLGIASHRWSVLWCANGTIQTSDMRHKSDIRDIDDNIFYNMIKNSGVHSYVLNYKDMPENITQETAPIEQVHVGIIAQEVAQNEGWEYVLNTTTNEDGDIEYSVNNYNLTSAVMAALKVEITKREELEQENQELRAEIEAIKAHVGL